MAIFRIKYKIENQDYMGNPRSGDCESEYEADCVEDAFKMCWDNDDYYLEDRTKDITSAVNIDTDEYFDYDDYR